MNPILLSGLPALSPGQQGIAELHDAGLWDQVIEEIDGRRIRVGDHWMTDFASCNYLGLDLDPQVQASVGEQIARWGTHPSWSRMLGSPRLYPQLEERLAELLGAPDVLTLPTISQIHLSAIPALAGKGGTILLDSRAHRTIYDGCVYARAQGATVKRFASGDLEQAAELLRQAPADQPRLVCMDGVNSMTGNHPDLTAFAELCREHGALLYVDDAHGMGVIGERRPDETSPYGARGNAVVKHTGGTYENIVLVGGLSKSYSSLLAFIACEPAVKRHLKITCPPYLYSGPVPTASLATAHAGLDVNAERGDALRAHLHHLTARVLDQLDAFGVKTPNESGFPLIEVPLRDPALLQPVGRALLDRGAYVTLAPYPGVPRDEVGFRIQLTAANTDAEVDALLDTLKWLHHDFSDAGSPMRPA
ncbi:aminotransferase class I/II-fold pyridoxal phosphate-dependent enzyme [Actinoplanes friuliensis]|uniref:8-amino-7-oxononanoate synthase n=1 Tax=Actinoplanes friuliensis DSM 7358 TaxID=1246995 RepID=U5VXI1_9ACTN|nr:pyridoxal phosphate-dependent aminotransferase family protein [Actinoplanes friuliensis]AGZ41678.1 8-amino-7-oxononanoate synthase [Actinoplanes friuliensis DSM 7358]